MDVADSGHFGERFEILRTLGEGGMGTVYEAYDRARNMRVAIKVLRRVDPVSLLRFKQEFRTATEISHENVINLYELVAHGDEWFFTMELVEGVSLLDHLRPPKTGQRTRAFPDGSGPRLRRTLAQLAVALHALHRGGLVHRDLKPSNVRVTASGRVVLMDFGIVADNRRGGERHGVATPVGTPPYMAPEQAAGDPPNASADWYAFGVVMYVALTGTLPFKGTRREILLAKQEREPPAPCDIASGIPDDLNALCVKLLTRRAHRRPSGQRVLRTLGVAPSTAAATLDMTIHPVFVGRRAELASLRGGMDAAATGKTVAYLVEGESGMGKSTLIHHFLDELDAESGDGAHPYILTGRCHERERLAFKAFDGVVDDLASVLVSLPAQVIDTLLPDDVPLLARLFPVLRRVSRIQLPARVARLNPFALRRRAALALAELFTRLAQLRPLLIYVDDLHWADRDGLELLEIVLGALSSSRIMFLASLRSEQLAEDRALREIVDGLLRRVHVRQIVLGPLSNDEQRDLIAQLSHGAPLLSALRDQQLEQFGDSPLFLVELLRYLEETNENGATLENLDLEEVLLRRIENLAPGSRAMLEMMALADEPLPLSVLGHAAQLSNDAGERAAAALRVGHLARIKRADTDPTLVCNHDRLREVLVRHLDFDARRAAHERLAHALEAWPEATPENLARHWLGAGALDRSTRYLREAAADARQKLAFDHAAELLQAALDLATAHDPTANPEETAARLLDQRNLGDALVLSGRCYEASQVYAEAVANSSDEQALELRRLSADNLLRSGHLVAGLRELSHVLAVLGAPVPRTRVGATLSFMVRRARLAIRGFDYTPRDPADLTARDLSRLDAMYAASTSLGMVDHLRGAAIQSRHLQTALKLGEERRALRALAIEVAYRMAIGGRHLARGEQLSKRVLARARKLGDPFLVGVVLMSLGGARFFAGRPSEAIGELAESVSLLTGIAEDAEWERVTARYFLALAQGSTGDFHGQELTIRHSLDVAGRRNDLYARMFFCCIPRTHQLLRNDDADGASDALDSALEGWPEEPTHNGHYMQAFARALIGLHRQQGDKTLRIIDDVRPRLRELLLHRMPWITSEVRWLEVRAALIAGNLDRARRASAKLARTKIPYVDALARLAHAAIAFRTGPRDDAVLRLRDAERALTNAGALHQAAAVQWRLGNLVESPETAKTLRARAGEWATSQSVKSPEHMWRALAPGFDE